MRRDTALMAVIRADGSIGHVEVDTSTCDQAMPGTVDKLCGLGRGHVCDHAHWNRPAQQYVTWTWPRSTGFVSEGSVPAVLA